MTPRGTAAHLEAVALSEAEVANVALVRFLSGVDAEMSLQLVRVGTGVRTVRTLVRTLACARVTHHV